MSSRHIPKKVKDEVRRRDGDRCVGCGRRSEYMEFDHITPHSKGGPSTVDNIRLICRKCNIKKKDKTPKCPHCGDWVAYESEYCRSCGKRIGRDATSVHEGSNLGRTVGLILLIVSLFLILKALGVVR
jgi:predicted RNA-binding Zn-ribbon protein involved in translation (DUF1610 family)